MTARTLAACLFIFPTVCFGQSILGKWKTTDDVTKEIRSIIVLSSTNGTVVGKILQIFPGPGEDPDPVCVKCAPNDPRYMKKIVGMEIIRGLKADGKEFVGGEILDPEDGKIYRLKVWLEGPNLKVRGYLGPLFRTQTWQPVD